MATQKPKQFKVVSVSSNTNSFGLYGVILMANDGEAYEVGANYMNVPKKGDILTNYVKFDDNGERIGMNLTWAQFGIEIPRRLENAPKEVINEVWNLTNN